MNWPVVLLWIGSYILGAIPFGVVIVKARVGFDITKVGSGNIGATNVHRVVGWKASAPVLVLDIAKGLVPPLIARAMQIAWLPSLNVVDVALLAGFAAVLGHCASPFLKFRGGKGVATICGAAIGATPLVALIGISVFVLVTAASRYVSLGSILGVLAAAIGALLLRYDGIVVGAFLAVWLFIIYKHRANISRLAKGQESKFNFRGGKSKPEGSNPLQKNAIRDDTSSSEDERRTGV